jgi:ectoine hydroxylase-related dioxygenase (phytanoyl-CoA dioxygenase family)
VRHVEQPACDGQRILDWKLGSAAKLRVNNYIALRSRSVGALPLKPVVGAILATLLGVPAARLWNSSLIYKPVEDSGDEVSVGWHADGAYWQTCTSDRMATAWIPLQRTTRAMGTLEVLDGSNRWPATAEVQALRRSQKAFSNAMAIDEYVRSLGHPFEPVALELEAGQFSVHHRLAIHGSQPNHGTEPRIAVMAGYQSSDNRYRRAFDEDGSAVEHEHDRICRRDADGVPDYADPVVCPQVWPVA